LKKDRQRSNRTKKRNQTITNKRSARLLEKRERNPEGTSDSSTKRIGPMARQKLRKRIGAKY
jgi:hypothetical protein